MAIKGLPAEGRELAGQVALVTGGAKNIGRAISLALAAAGAAVAVNTLRSREDAETVVREIRAAGGDAEIFIADVADADAVRAMCAAWRSDSTAPLQTRRRAGLTQRSSYP